MLNDREGAPQRARNDTARFLPLLAVFLLPVFTRAEDNLDPRAAIELTRAVMVEVTVTQQISGGRRYEFGAGVVIHPSGLVATTLHTVDHPGQITVRLSNDSVLPARIVSTFREIDAAVLKFEAPEPHPAVRASRRQDIVAGRAIVAGIPQRGERSLRLANVNAAPSDVKYHLVSRSTKIVSFEADITLGFSGGPVIDLDGELVGMILARNSNGLRRGYCLPADVLLTALGVDSLAGYPLPAVTEMATAVAAVEVKSAEPTRPTTGHRVATRIQEPLLPALDFENRPSTLSSEQPFRSDSLVR